MSCPSQLAELMIASASGRTKRCPLCGSIVKVGKFRAPTRIRVWNEISATTSVSVLSPHAQCRSASGSDRLFPTRRRWDSAGRLSRRRKTGDSHSLIGGWNMSAEPTRCPKCNGAMVQGFIFDLMEPCAKSAPGSRGRRKSPSGKTRRSRRNRSSRSAPTGARRAVSWSPTLGLSSLPSNRRLSSSFDCPISASPRGVRHPHRKADRSAGRSVRSRTRIAGKPGVT